ncbi:ABC transporter ATP-binding protein [Streptomyces sp. NBC_00825]|uniref:dipeptide ABC transporter ATP-binding protein n=1 Tax=unclassified Streptomyces TaxID=2593676 RepID=UPI00224EC013|nr:MULTISPECIES: ABC transporter ATP-binding protein [unclassified Streptomyces]WTB54210.1 ABC transporter ATP-binding protein [Streptomyces sp. NBC_00826]WTH92901.1 ABC transporter ATP-binding protein [Streptomyces sp. NBC_00825]WTI01632.1 ABC transporter ATP-binding protein [Streptomyces sp. NBC_00822]MCX4867233.1 ABC transporter ATP-binding protein [Streptomyces sp. NBC_00906]MCX4898471.1 ABC transporter ATP-binding protein [Streptomyces sp. NBC_00892]
MTLTTPAGSPAATGPTPVLSVRDLRVTFPSEAGPVEAVRGVGFDLLPGRTLGIVGESGSGKSATAMAVMGLLPPSAELRGQVLLGGRDLIGLGDKELSAVRGNSIGMVFQDPLSALTPIFSVGRLLSDALRVHQDLTKRAAWEQAVELLDLVGIPDPRGRAKSFPHEFSGGMRQRVVIAMAIANKPSVLVADEPTTALDVTVQAQILDVLRVAQKETGAGLVLITHDLGVVAGHADDIAVMYAGRFVERAGVDELFRRPAMPYTARLLAAVPTVDSGVHRPLVPIGGEPPALVDLPGGCPFASRCAVARDECRADEPELREITGHGHVACLRADEIADGTLDPAGETGPGDRPSGSGSTETGDVVLRVEDLVKTFPVTKGALLKRRVGTLHAVNRVSFELRAGETLGLVGESGSGKTTTLLEVLRLKQPEGGRIEVAGTDVATVGSAARVRELRRDVRIVMQDPLGALNPRLPVFQLLAEPLRAIGRDRESIRSRIHELLTLVGLDASVSGRFPAALSGGQRQRVGIARALATEPKLLALDEPLSALDVSVQAGVINLLARLKRELGLAYLVVAHDLAVVRYISDRIAVMYLGHIVETGDTETIFADPKHPYTRALLSAIPVPDPLRERARERVVLRGEQPSATRPPAGCVFVDRCPLYRLADEEVRRRCRTERPEPTAVAGSAGHQYACHAV